MPRIIFNGNVNPSDIPIYNAGLTSGIACLSTAGTAIYEALAANTMNNIVGPNSKPTSLQIVNANAACTNGPAIA